MSDLPVYWYKSHNSSVLIMLMRMITLVTLMMIAESNAEASLQSSPDNRGQSCCSDGHGLNYTLPMFRPCLTAQREDGSTVVTIPKLIPASPLDDDTQCRRKNKHGIPPGRRVCRLPDCMNDPCEHGWCEETMTGYQCHSFDNSSITVGDKDTTITSAITTTTTTTKSTRETPQPATTSSSTTPSQDLCLSTPCKNGGTCEQLVTSFLCT
eukprot:XP_011678515.1 PREDICTED: delta-like protein B [Strongylocentrotus purpuratus]